MATPKLTILLSGMIAAVPHQGGATWAVLQYLLGLKRLGHDVYFVDPVEEAALLLAGTQQTVGLPYARLSELAPRTDVLINISGLLADEALTANIPLRVYLDLDPAFTQLWYAAEGIDMGFAGHTHFVTVGQAIGDTGCEVPTCGLEWITTPQPIVLEHWPAPRRIIHNALTTVANWRGYGSIEHEGVFYGQKVHSLREFITLPTLTQEKFVLALAIHPDEGRDLA